MVVHYEKTIIFTNSYCNYLGTRITYDPCESTNVTDPQNDVIGLKSWTEDGEPKFDCTWLPVAPAVAMIDIEKIEWLNASVDYTVNMTFYGTPNATYLESSDIVVYMYFLIDGTPFPDDS